MFIMDMLESSERYKKEIKISIILLSLLVWCWFPSGRLPTYSYINMVRVDVCLNTKLGS